MPTIEELKREIERLENFEESKQDIRGIEGERKILQRRIRQLKSPRLQLFKRISKQIGRDIIRTGRVGGKAVVLVSKDVAKKLKARSERQAAKEIKLAKLKRKVKRKVKRKIKKRIVRRRRRR